jgi:hypothetical protein
MTALKERRVKPSGKLCASVMKELLTRDDFYGALIRAEGVIVVIDIVGRTAHPVSCPSLEGTHFVEKVIVNQRKNGRYYWVRSISEARRELDAEPCQCR